MVNDEVLLDNPANESRKSAGDTVRSTLTNDEIIRLARYYGCEPTGESLFAAVFTQYLLTHSAQ